jgi:hypothetical protein
MQMERMAEQHSQADQALHIVNEWRNQEYAIFDETPIHLRNMA